MAENVTLEVGLPPGCTAEAERVRGKKKRRVERGETAYAAGDDEEAVRQWRKGAKDAAKLVF